MFENCQGSRKDNKCSEVAEKLVHLFGWRQTYKVEKLQKSLTAYNTHRGAKEFVLTQRAPPKQKEEKCHRAVTTQECSDINEGESCKEFIRNNLQKSYLCLPSNEVSVQYVKKCFVGTNNTDKIETTKKVYYKTDKRKERPKILRKNDVS
ncbi:hypothetical protein RUM43_014069 [Polyplax serrata]|uniref:Uncharacterized protein n=1 Tax=Polyplax serrata TaxID=468196 RepID=A0AAN8PBJ9_POLSC